MSPISLLNDEVLTILITKDAEGNLIPARDMAAEAKAAKAAEKVAKAGRLAPAGPGETRLQKDEREAHIGRWPNRDGDPQDARDERHAREAALGLPNPAASALVETQAEMDARHAREAVGGIPNVPVGSNPQADWDARHADWDARHAMDAATGIPRAVNSPEPAGNIANAPNRPETQAEIDAIKAREVRDGDTRARGFPAPNETPEVRAAREATESKDAKETAAGFTATIDNADIKTEMGSDPRTGIPTVTLTPMVPFSMGRTLLIHDKAGDLVDMAVINVVPRHRQNSLDFSKAVVTTQEIPEYKRADKAAPAPKVPVPAPAPTPVPAPKPWTAPTPAAPVAKPPAPPAP